MKKIESTPYYRHQRCAPFAFRLQGRIRFVQQPKPHRLQLVWTREARPVRDRRRHRSQPRRTYQSLYRTSFYPPLQQRRSRPHRAQAPRSVRFILDDFANLNIPHIDDMLAVIRSREISTTIICQTVSQPEARYGMAEANSIIGNCDRQLLLAVQDEATARYFSLRANKPAFALLETPANTWWYFERVHSTLSAWCEDSVKPI